MKNIIDLLFERADLNPDKNIIRFLSNNQLDFYDLTFEHLLKSSKNIAYSLLQIAKPEDRVIILMHPGLDFIKAFYGCLMAGIIAIPLLLPKKMDHAQKLKNLIKKADTKLILTNSEVLFELNILLSLYIPEENIYCYGLDDLDIPCPLFWSPPKISLDQIAYLQFTSGSTQLPRGAKITHRNLIHSLEMLSEAGALNQDDIACSWLPHMHNMGLFDTTLNPIYSGIPILIMSPFHFLEEPHKWLELISKFKATISGASCGGYELCLSAINQEQINNLDLSTWRLAFVGGEMVRKDILERFHERFKETGFNFNAFVPSYGLAEATIFVSGKTLHKPSKFLSINFQSEANQKNKKAFVKIATSVGSPSLKQKVIIVNPETCQQIGEKEIGEIWITGPNIAGGYWNDEKRTEESFQGKLAEDSTSTTYLRTGDLGLISEGELYLVGRQKEVIIIRGVNHYPEDIEYSAKHALPQMKDCTCAAFSIEIEDREELCILFEIPQESIDFDEIFSAIISKVADDHELSVHTIVLVPQKALPKTVSGKIKRLESRDHYLNGDIFIIKEWTKGDVLAVPSQEAEKETNLSQNDWLDHIVSLVAEESHLQPHQIDPSKNFNFYGIDSLSSMRLLSEIQQKASCDIPFDILANSSSIKIFAEHIRQLAEGKTFPKKQEKFSKLEDIPEDYYNFSLYKPWIEFQKRRFLIEDWGIENPYFRLDEGVSNHLSHIDGKELINYSSFNYLSLADHPLMKQSAKDAMDLYGISSGSSRLFSQKKIHVECEKAIANFVGTEAALLFVQGHATNTTTLGHLFNERDIIFCDSLDHNSIYQGSLLSHAKVIPFPHNNWEELEKLLTKHRLHYEKCVIVIEGAYSMEGDIPLIPEFIRLKKKYCAFLMIDEAHSLGVIGETGRGILEHYHANPSDVDILMGTISKALASCGGFIAGSRDLIEYLSYTAPGFVYSIAISPALCAAALTAIQIIDAEPQRIRHLYENGEYFRKVAKSYGFDIGVSQYTPIVPIFIRDTERAFKLSQRLYQRGINVHPITYPVVPVETDRLRFCITYGHTHEQMDYTLKVLHEELLSSGMEDEHDEQAQTSG